MLPLVFAMLLSANANPSVLSVPIATTTATTTYSKAQLVQMATSTAAEYGLNVGHFLAVINCESGWDPTATSTTDDYGLLQVNLKAHADVSMEEADDPVFALNWAAHEWQEGNASIWVCWNRLYSSSTIL